MLGIWQDTFEFCAEAFRDIYNLDPEAPQAYRAKAALHAMLDQSDRSQAAIDRAGR